MITYTDLKRHVVQVLGGTPSTQVTYDQIVNGGGRAMFGMHPWAFRSRELKRLNFPSDGTTAYLLLPMDFGEIVGQPQKTGARTESFELTTMDDINFHRHASISRPVLHTKAALVFPTPDTRDETPLPRLELWPTPASGNTQTVNIEYRARWVPLVQDADTANVPEYAEALLIRVIRAFAKGYEEDYDMELEERLEPIYRSELFQRTKQQDGLVHGSFGPMRGGHIGGRYTDRGIATATVTASNPS